MKAEELMIGDWVDIRLLDDEPGEHMYSQVEQLWECEIDADFETSYDNVYPIPLTTEILEKNGYTSHDDLAGRGVEWISEDNRIIMSDWEYDINSNNHWYIHIDNEDMDTICTAEITYVHEFQHLLKLCKIEKKITL